MMKRTVWAALAAAPLLFPQYLLAQTKGESVDRRGDQAMGFSHDKTSHHFRLLADGGAIEIVTDDPRDTGNRDRIREHLQHIAAMFSAGDFDLPMFIHDRVPPGVPSMRKLKSQIEYRFETIELGGRIRISSRNPRAVKAVHDFLKFQILDHRTGDSLQVSTF
jgi:hypothetical protein